MRVIFGFSRIKRHRKPVVALGVFDGVHRGHINILRGTSHKARNIRGTSIVLTFWPHPQRQESLYSLEHRLRLIAEKGIDVCVVIKFNKKFARISATGFIKDILFKKFHAHYVYVGKNFRFGKGAKGDFKNLSKLSKIYNFKLKLFKVIKIKNKPISSTYIRSLIKKGDLKAAKRLLSRPVSILGTVIKGSFLARKLGFPTANINPHHEVIPPSGIYAVRIIFDGIGKYKILYYTSPPALLHKAKQGGKKIWPEAALLKSYLPLGKFSCEKKFYGICYIGTNPTLKAQKSIHVEVHIFNFMKNIYGKDLEIQFVKKIRDEKKFASCQSLVKQVKKDILRVKGIFYYAPQHVIEGRAS